MENRKMYDGKDYSKKVEALEMFRSALIRLDQAMDAIDTIASELGLNSEKHEAKECQSKEHQSFSLEELAKIVSDKTGFCPHAVAAIIDVILTTITEMSEEEPDDAD